MRDFLLGMVNKFKLWLARSMLNHSLQTLKGSLGNEKKRKGYIRLLVALVLIYSFVVLLTIHTKHIHLEKPYLPFFPALEQGLIDMFKRPLQIFPVPPGTGTAIVCVTMLCIFSMLLMDISYSIRAHDDPDTVQGDQRWFTELDKYNIEYTEPLGEVGHDDINNMIFTQDIYLSTLGSIDMNLNALIIGGSGSGKSFRYVAPNLLQANNSYVVTDPSGTLMRQYGKYLENKGYKVKCLNLNHMEKGNHYNPFRYIHSDKDVMVMVDTLISNTKKKDSASGEQIWEDGLQLLLNAICSYLFNYTEKSQHNFSNAMKLMKAISIDENDPNAPSALDSIFAEVEAYDPDSFAVSNYKDFKQGAGKTLKSFVVTGSTRFRAFNLPEVAALTNTDDIDLDSIWEEKTVLFVTLPTGEGPFNFLASMLYSQLFQRAYNYVENTSCFTQLIIDSEKQVVKSYKAGSEEEAEERRIEADAFLEKIKKGRVKRNRETKLYEVLTEDGELVCFRGSGKEARKELRSIIEGGRVISNKDQTRDGSGQRLPIQVMFLMDEFANSATRFAPKTVAITDKSAA